MQEGYLRLLQKAFPEKAEAFASVMTVSIDAALRTLRTSEAYVLRQRFGMECEPMKVKDVATELRCSSTSITNTTNRGLRKLRHPSRAKIMFGEVSTSGASAWTGDSVHNPILKERVEDRYDLSARARKALTNANILYIGDLVQQTDALLLRKKNFGRKCLKEIKAALAQDGLSLGMRIDNWNPLD